MSSRSSTIKDTGGHSEIVVAEEIRKKKFHHLLLYSIGLVILILLGIATLNLLNDNKPSVVKTVDYAQEVPIQVSITKTGYFPSTVSAQVGRIIIWTNYDSVPHTVSANPYPFDNGPGNFKSKPISPQKTYQIVFKKSGTYKYHDDLNPTTFNGTIVVSK